MSLPEPIRELIDKFDEHSGAYKSSKYNETKLRREFLDPFFEAMGWVEMSHQCDKPGYGSSIIKKLSI
ncbi:MAG: hypothetical protein ABUK01_02985 [Leptospirales bacterium]